MLPELLASAPVFRLRERELVRPCFFWVLWYKPDGLLDSRFALRRAVLGLVVFTQFMTSLRRSARASKLPVPASEDPTSTVNPQDFIDSMAEESDDAQVGAVHLENDVASDLSDITESDLSDFIDDDDQMDCVPTIHLLISPRMIGIFVLPVSSPPAIASPTDSITSAVDHGVQESDLKTPVRRRKNRKSVPKVNDSDEEDLETMAPTDRMFARPPAVKASLLPAPLDTRSSVKRRLGSDTTLDSATASDSESSPTKKTKSEKGDIKTVDPSSASGFIPVATTFDIENYLARYMAKQGPLLAEAVVKGLMPVLTDSIKSSVAALAPSNSVLPAGGLESSAFVTPPKRSDSSSLQPPGHLLVSTPDMSIDSPFSSLSKDVNHSPFDAATGVDVFGSVLPSVVGTAGVLASVSVSPPVVVQDAVADARSAPADALVKTEPSSVVVSGGHLDLAGLGACSTLIELLFSLSMGLLRSLSLLLLLTFPGGNIDLGGFGSMFDAKPKPALPPWMEDAIEKITRVTLESAMVMTHDGAFINPARISPALIETRPASNGSTQRRLNVEGKVAICVSPGMCSESYLVRPHVGSGVNGRKRKFISLTLHNQEWERWESFMCLCFAQAHLFTPMTRSAIQIGSMLDTRAQNKRVLVQVAEAYRPPLLLPLLLGSLTRSARDTPTQLKKQYLCTMLPSKNFDFLKDLPTMKSVLPVWSGEVPIGSLSLSVIPP
ncbi:hypothetical protein B0H11DRAFT_2252467 [Mycena galericulata]|nr:hypothetical protein B0H11DRAFT_2252467 [Mycena galericulata]